MKTQNLILSEKIREAEHTNNELALAIAKDFEGGEVVSAELFEELKDAYLDLMREKCNEFCEQLNKEYEKGGYEFDLIDEAYAEQVAYECGDIEKLKEHIQDCIFSENWIKGEWVSHCHISEESHKKLEGFIMDEWLELSHMASEDVFNAFKTDICYAMQSNKGLFYVAMFGEVELEKPDFLRVLPDAITEDDINRMSDFYLSGNYIYLDKSYEGISYSINLNWLEKAILEIGA